MKLAIYGHGGSQNHGNEAIVRGVREIFPDAEIMVYSFSPEVDKKFGLDEVCKLKRMVSWDQKFSFWNIARGVINKIRKWFIPSLNEEYMYFAIFHPFIKEICPDTIYLLEAGDQYCEPGPHRAWYAYLNQQIHKRGARSVMLGCSINANLFEQTEMVQDLLVYDKIIARESLTYQMLIAHGITKVSLAPDPAFAMKCKKWGGYRKQHFIGVNAGFLAQGNEFYTEQMHANFRELVRYIIEETEYEVLLIPHVYWDEYNADKAMLQVWYSEFKDSGKIHLIKEHSAPEAKYILSLCDIVVALRTHASIPAIESCVPTIMTGYKGKTTGIHNDVMNGEYSLLLPIQDMTDNSSLKEKMQNVICEREKIIEYLQKRIPEYKLDLDIIKTEINDIINSAG